jgi:putative nucleotidyltransferase with HDIG domain
MLGTPANRPFIYFRWLLYAVLIVAALVVPYLTTENENLQLFRGLWIGGAYAIFLTLYSVSNLPNTNRLTFSRLGLMLGETALCILFVTLFGTASGPFAAALLIAPLLISIEHHWKYGIASGVIASIFLLSQGGFGQSQVVLSLLAVGLPLIGTVLSRVEHMRREIHDERDFTKLDKAYQIARRESSRRQEHEQELHREKRRFEGLVSIAQGLAEEREQEKLLSRIVDVASDQLSARGAVVFLLQDGKLSARAESGLSQPMMEALKASTDADFLNSLTATGQPLSFGAGDPPPEDPEALRLLSRFARLIDPKQKRRPTEMLIRQLVAVPLTTAQDHQAFGLLLALNHNLDQSFSSAECRYLQVLSTNAAIALKNILFTVQLERSHWELIQALAQAIEAKDSYTSNHVGRVRDLSVEIARTIGLDRNKTRVIAIAATLHDVGKISTPDRVLLKPGPLTDEEYEIMKQHAANGAQILRGIRSLPDGVEPMVRHHHERWDGKGYPDGKRGKDIPLGAQIISIADCYDAMTYDRPYRKGFPKLTALQKMELGCGTQFNPKLLCAFFAVQGFVPKTEPTAIDTYQQIIGKLHLGGRMSGDSSQAMVNTPHSTGASETRTEQKTKPLLMERN